VTAQVLATAFHFEQDDRFPNQVGKCGAAVVSFFDALFADGAGLLHALEAESLEEVIEKDLGLACWRSSCMLWQSAGRGLRVHWTGLFGFSPGNRNGGSGHFCIDANDFCRRTLGAKRR
jgi:hypothetical protein